MGGSVYPTANPLDPVVEPSAGEPTWIAIPLPVDDASVGMRLDRFVQRRIRRLSRTRVQTIIGRGQVSRLGVVVLRASLRVRAGETYVIKRPPLVEHPAPLHFGVVHREDALLVIDKPAGLPVHPTACYHHHTLTAVMRTRLGTGHGWEMAHRLDRETSGLMVFGRAGTTARALKRAFQDRAVQKRYLAIVHGHLTEPRRISIPLGPAIGSKVRIKIGAVDRCAGGVEAITDIEPVAAARFSGRPMTLVRAWPRTGRQHQIRVHLAEVGHPVLGDKMYGLDEQWFIAVSERRIPMAALDAHLGIDRHALHAEWISVPHPLHGGPVEFTARWPAQLAAIVRAPEGRTDPGSVRAPPRRPEPRR